jgi:uncharacterized iron-regulated membrane protein
MRKVVVLLHRYIGLALGLFLLVSGLTGSAIVFSKAIDAYLNPRLLTVTPRPGAAARIDDVLRNVQQAMPEERPNFVYLPQLPNEAVEVLLQASGMRIYADPYSAEVLGKRYPNSSLTGFLIDLHVHLLAGKTGERILGWAGLGAVVLSCLGIVLWWPKHGRWKQAFSIKWQAGSFRVWFDTHRVIGAVALVFIVLTAVTGSALALYEIVTEPALIAITGKGTRQPPPKSLPGHGPRAPIDPMLAQAASMYPDAKITRITLPAKEKGAVTVRMRLNGEIHQFGRTFIWFNQYDGSLLRIDNALTAHHAVRIQSWLFPLHTGTYGGIMTQCLQVLVGLSLSFLTLSGAWLWVKRVKSKATVIARRAAVFQNPD